MSKIEILKDIIIPILAAIIGGLFTFIGVYITIIHEKKKDKEKLVLANKPLFYRIDPMQEYNYKQAVDFYLAKENRNKKEGQIFGIIKNTDNSIFIIEEVIINEMIYKPLHGNVVDKNQIINLYIEVSKKLNDSDEFIMIIRDVMNNKYKYKIEYKFKSEDYCEIIGFKEIK